MRMKRKKDQKYKGYGVWYSEQQTGVWYNPDYEGEDPFRVIGGIEIAERAAPGKPDDPPPKPEPVTVGSYEVEIMGSHEDEHFLKEIVAQLDIPRTSPSVLERDKTVFFEARSYALHP